MAKRKTKLREVIASLWHRLTKFGALFTTIVGTLGLSFGIAIFLLDWAIGTPGTPPYVLATHQFVASVTDAVAIFDARVAAAEQASLELKGRVVSSGGR